MSNKFHSLLLMQTSKQDYTHTVYIYIFHINCRIILDNYIWPDVLITVSVTYNQTNYSSRLKSILDNFTLYINDKPLVLCNELLRSIHLMMAD
jgi:hypothetical protein